MKGRYKVYNVWSESQDGLMIHEREIGEYPEGEYNIEVMGTTDQSLADFEENGWVE